MHTNTVASGHAPFLVEDAERFIEEVRGDDPERASYLRIAERELEAGGLNQVEAGGDASRTS
jgi:hypothetical protein